LLSSDHQRTTGQSLVSSGRRGLSTAFSSRLEQHMGTARGRRITLDLDEPLLRELKRLQREERTPLGRLVSDLLVFALRQRRSGAQAYRPFRWFSQPMGARVD